MVLKPAKSMSRYDGLAPRRRCSLVGRLLKKGRCVAENYNSLNEFAFCAKHLSGTCFHDCFDYVFGLVCISNEVMITSVHLFFGLRRLAWGDYTETVSLCRLFLCQRKCDEG